MDRSLSGDAISSLQSVDVSTCVLYSNKKLKFVETRAQGTGGPEHYSGGSGQAQEAQATAVRDRSRALG